MLDALGDGSGAGICVTRVTGFDAGVGDPSDPRECGLPRLHSKKIAATADVVDHSLNGPRCVDERDATTMRRVPLWPAVRVVSANCHQVCSSVSCCQNLDTPGSGATGLGRRSPRLSSTSGTSTRAIVRMSVPACPAVCGNGLAMIVSQRVSEVMAGVTWVQIATLLVSVVSLTFVVLTFANQRRAEFQVSDRKVDDLAAYVPDGPKVTLVTMSRKKRPAVQIRRIYVFHHRPVDPRDAAATSEWRVLPRDSELLLDITGIPLGERLIVEYRRVWPWDIESPRHNANPPSRHRERVRKQRERLENPGKDKANPQCRWRIWHSAPLM